MPFLVLSPEINFVMKKIILKNKLFLPIWSAKTLIIYIIVIGGFQS